MKIRIIGGAGTGKTTLAKHISQQFSIQHINLDELVYCGTENALYLERRNNEETKRLIQKAIEKPSWIIEGTWYRKSIAALEAADCIIVLHNALPVRLWRIQKRYSQRRKKGYPDTRRTLVRLLWNNIWFQKKWNRRYNELQKQYPRKTHAFRRLKDAEAHLNAFLTI